MVAWSYNHLFDSHVFYYENSILRVGAFSGIPLHVSSGFVVDFIFQLYSIFNVVYLPFNSWMGFCYRKFYTICFFIYNDGRHLCGIIYHFY